MRLAGGEIVYIECRFIDEHRMLLEMEINLLFPDRVGFLEKTKHLGLGALALYLTIFIS